MIKIKLRFEGDRLESLEFSGHAGYDVKGEDIVCAAVSVLFINTVNSIEKFTEDEIRPEKTKDGYRLIFPEEISDKAKVLIDSLIFGIENIEKEYGENFISLARIKQEKKS